jgi:glycosyltransferase involved in cell wall biosynthesis
MQNKPFASFCFSTYKRPSYLHDTLARLREQSLGDFEVIVSDNDPDETGRSVVESFQDTRFHYFPNGENLGMKKSYNKSLERSSGEYIIMIADDDPVYPDMLQTLYDLHLKYPGYGMYLGGCDWFCESHEVGKMYNLKVGTNSCLAKDFDLDHTQAYSAGEFLEKLFAFGIFPHYLWSTAIIRREVLVEKGGVPEYGTPFLGDYAYMAVMASDSGCVIINRALGCQTLHEENFGRQQHEQIPVAARNFPEYIKQKASHLPNWGSIEEKMLRFTGLWVVTHMAFLYRYNKSKGINDPALKKAEKEVFDLPFMKKFRFKFYLKKNFPLLHELAVRIKKI